VINGKSVLIIVPAWNEAEAITDVIKEIQAELPSCPVLVVDDGSADTTSIVAASAGATVLKLPYNLGVGGARRLGYKYARDKGFDVVVQIDADGQHDPKFIPSLVDALDEADLVIGARFAGIGDYSVRGPRKWAMSLLGGVLSWVAGARLSDTTSGFRVTNRQVTELYAETFPVEYLGDTVETIVHIARAGLRVRQVPVAMRPRMAGTPSHGPAKAAIYLARSAMVLGLALVRRYERVEIAPKAQPQLPPAPAAEPELARSAKAAFGD
jgi:glycosyltransferase involved in cell wall biosynthesis